MVIARATLGVLTAFVGMSSIACHRSEHDVGAVPPPETKGASATPSSSGAYPAPQMDLGPDRFAERVDGAEAKLRARGCRRMLVWRLATPPSDLEVLRFESPLGATQMLVDDAGQDRTPGLPGDEGWTGSNVLYFRSGSVYVRLVADAPTPPETLLESAQRIAQALANREVQP